MLERLTRESQQFGVHGRPEKAIILRLTSRAGARMPSFIRSSRSIPPALARTNSPSVAAASKIVFSDFDVTAAIIPANTLSPNTTYAFGLGYENLFQQLDSA